MRICTQQFAGILNGLAQIRFDLVLPDPDQQGNTDPDLVAMKLTKST
jgi:hypothetical protein